MFIKVKNLKKSYGEKENRMVIINDINLNVEKGRICTILGPSGSGKSTLLNLIGGLEEPDSGSIEIDGIDITELNSKKLALFRRNKLGFVFQFYNLIPNLTVRENIEVCEYLSKDSLKVDELIGTLGLEDHQKKFPRQISGGQQQRTALARALSKNPALLLCDEPTGALDYKSSKELLALLEQINKKYNTTILIVTHNNAIANMSHQVINLRDGLVSENYVNEKPVQAADLTW
ncbi:ABC transporter ATP-binding protein [Anaerocolumna xylanovorans]|uniref:Putative ABC transport system ATP-binding protein n=1 Tax=Anaerocolumna xylanovorans DSM 12503 TaxID=1121345 RepID=A0A1M7YIE5_9FIRM|nr:ABC transporter ATP-binding protein [Anaerocolumna xylanovorans]SHO52359.1 putative ABC transport system ATP-binding protein [Anaerocolumna xylanovorans DSM 12503]